MPRNPQFSDKDATISVYHNNNSQYGQYPSPEFISVIRHILPIVNKNGFKTYAEAEHARDLIAARAQTHSTQILVKDFMIVNSKGKYYVLPALD